jgi:hypothetical protein
LRRYVPADTAAAQARILTMEVKRLALGTRERIAGAVYGTIVVLAALAAGATAYQYDLWRLGAIVSASVLILWIAHAYAHALGESLRLGRRLTRIELMTITGRELAIPLASILPLVAIALGALGLVRDRTAIWLALAIGVATLAVQGIRYARLERLSRIGTLVSVALNLSLGLLIVALKVLLAH